MENKTPLLSVGMPAYNSETEIGDAIDSILKQTYSNFELIISDNASTDSTQSICEEYASRDPRIRYIRNAVNIGDRVFLHRASKPLQARLMLAGFGVHEIELTEFLKAGGSAKCLTLKLTEPPHS